MPTTESEIALQQPDQDEQIRTRLAPTPSGYLHLGNVLSFAITWALARQHQGRLILRIDDLDTSRFRQQYLQDIFDTLDFMGLDYDEGPNDAADFRQHYSQCLRLPQYQRLLEALAQQGQVYACSCSRGALLNGRYPLHCRFRQLPLDTPATAWRLRMPTETVITFKDLLQEEYTVALSDEMPDFVVLRKDGIPAYQVASLCDDLAMDINLIVRGEDLLTSTAAQLYLAQALGKKRFTQARFLHHPVLRDSSGHKLSKSEGALSVRHMRKSGLKPQDVWAKIAKALHLPDAAAVTDGLSFQSHFSLEHLQQLRRQQANSIS